jgi:hypothetical protein
MVAIKNDKYRGLLKVKKNQQDKARFSIGTKQITVVLIMLFAFTSCENPIMIKLLEPLIPKIVPGNTLAEKLNWLAKNALNEVDYTVTVNEGETIGSGNQLYYNGKKVSVTITGGSVSLKDVDNFSVMFAVKSNVTLILENITLKGRNDNNAPLVYVDGGALIMNKGAKITGNNSDWGGGVRVQESGTFTMNDGEIFGNTAENDGGGVNIWSNGTFTMNGGTIFGNTAKNGGGGGVINNGGTFTMNGGEISGNTAIHIGDNTGLGGGVFTFGTFIMKGGEISNNTAWMGGGVWLGGNFIMSGGKISGNTAKTAGGVGVATDEGFTMRGGEISGNTASVDGGGVAVWENSKFIMSGGEIFGNTASNGHGGGVVIWSATFNMNGSASISGNTAKDGYGGGIAVWGGTFTKSGGTITGYASDTVNGNVVRNSNNFVKTESGHAVNVHYDNAPAKRRESTAGTGVNLDTNKDGSAGGWE